MKSITADRGLRHDDLLEQICEDECADMLQRAREFENAVDQVDAC